MSLERKLIEFPPVLCRLLARKIEGTKRTVPKTDTDLAKETGLPLAEIKRLSWLCSWDKVEVGVLVRFVTACGCDFSDPRQIHTQRMFLGRTRGRIPFLEKHDLWDDVWKPLFLHFVDYLKTRKTNN